MSSSSEIHIDKQHIAVLVDQRSDVEKVKTILTGLQQSSSSPSSITHEIFRVSTGPSLFDAIRRIHAGSFTYTLNLCTSDNEDAAGVSPGLVAMLLEQHNLPYTGCRSAALAYSLDILFMMAWYAGLPLPAFRIIRAHEGQAPPQPIAEAMMKKADDEQHDHRVAVALSSLQRPVRVCSTSPWCRRWAYEVTTEESEIEAVNRIQTSLTEHGDILLWEAVGCVEVQLIACSTGNEQTPLFHISTKSSVSSSECRWRDSSSWASLEAKLREWGAAFMKLVLYDIGLFKLTFMVRSAPEEEKKTLPFQCFLTHMDLNPSLLLSDDSLAPPLFITSVLSALGREALRKASPPTFTVQLHSDSRKGYRLCAARHLTKGEIVFEDEGRAFAIVTRPHVEAAWSDEQKRTFTEYAWPLDSEGHAYAIWEENPFRWRPINHCCDPNCIFAAPHSLNVIAARDISAGEDLTMDYATFCDGTMKPFHCLCGSAQCRGWIQADEVSLAKYGKNAWFRKVPAPVKPLLE